MGLHYEAKVALGLCSYDALTAFSKAPKPASMQTTATDDSNGVVEGKADQKITSISTGYTL